MVTSALILFPNLVQLLAQLGDLQKAGVFLIVAFFSAQPAFFLERKLFDDLWHRLYPEYRIRERKALVEKRVQIVATAEANQLNHDQYDQAIGEFVLYFNTSFWLFLMSGGRLVWWSSNSLLLMGLAAFILVSSACSLVYVAPYFKKSYLDTLEVLNDFSSNNHETKGLQ